MWATDITIKLPHTHSKYQWKAYYNFPKFQYFDDWNNCACFIRTTHSSSSTDVYKSGYYISCALLRHHPATHKLQRRKCRGFMQVSVRYFSFYMMMMTIWSCGKKLGVGILRYLHGFTYFIMKIVSCYTFQWIEVCSQVYCTSRLIFYLIILIFGC